MQDRYTGDIGDYGKFGLLNALAGRDLKLGVVWYLFPDAEANGDGQFVACPHLRHCDPCLHDKLAAIVAGGDRRVAAVEQCGILPPDTVFYSTPLSFRDLPSCAIAARRTRRREWLDGALAATAEADMVFMDPDNGFAGSSASPTANSGPKYVFLDEVEPFIRRGQSVIVYHHQTREAGGLGVQVERQFSALREMSGVGPWAFAFRRRSVRVYLVVPATAHLEILVQRSAEFLDGSWGQGGHFQICVARGCARSLHPHQ